jgi:excisionase family DNA binding protein
MTATVSLVPTGDTNSANDSGSDRNAAKVDVETPRRWPDVTLQHPLMTMMEAASLVGIPRLKLYRLVSHGEIPFFKVGFDYRFQREAIEICMPARRSG